MAINTILFSGAYVVLASFLGIVLFILKVPSNLLCSSDILDLPLRFLPRIQSTFSSPSFLSSFLVILIFVLFDKIICTKQLIKQRYLFIVYIVLSALVFIFTFSRDLIGLGWGLILFFSWRGINSKFGKLFILSSKFAMVLITLLVLVISCWYIFPIKVFKSDSSIVLPQHALQYKLDAGNIVSQNGWLTEKVISFNIRPHNRVMELRDAGKTFLRSPLLGIGVGVLPSQGYFPQPYSRSSHNTYLQILSQTGILGFVVFIIFLVYLFRLLRRRYETEESLSHNQVILQVVLIVFLINMIYIDLDNFRYFWIISGLILSLNNPSLKND